MKKFKEICSKIASVLQSLIGISLAICLFGGGLGFIGYVIALCVGGDMATEICQWIYKSYYGFIIKLSTWTTVATFILVYIKGDAQWVNPFKRNQNKSKA